MCQREFSRSRSGIRHPQTQEELNERAYLASVNFCAHYKHGRHGMTRQAFYAAHCVETGTTPFFERNSGRG